MQGTSYPVIKSYSPDEVRTVLVSIIERLLTRPEFAPVDDERVFDLTGDGRPAVKVAVADCQPDFDLWAGLRNPAGVGLHPIGLPELWEFWAHHMAAAGPHRSIFRVPEPYEQARRRLGRAVVISVMLPISRNLLREHYELIRLKRTGSAVNFHDSVGRVAQILDEAISSLPQLMDGPGPVVVLTKDNVARITELTVPPVRRQDGHGPGRGVNFSQKSAAVLTGLGQFGAHRLVIRDEIVGGRIERFLGPIRTVVIFDSSVPGSADGVRSLTRDWSERLQALYSGGPDEQRICRYYDPDADQRCSACIDACPPGAVLSSLPDADTRDDRRLWDGELQFDTRSCTGWRNQLGAMFGSWACVRCLTACAVAGKRDRSAVAAFTGAGSGPK